MSHSTVGMKVKPSAVILAFFLTHVVDKTLYNIVFIVILCFPELIRQMRLRTIILM